MNKLSLVMYVNSNNYIRKIDELGRIVIPKEVRNKLKIQDNESILISLDDNKINISKYSYLNNYNRFINELCNQLTEIFKLEISISDREKDIFSNITEKTSNVYNEDIIKDSTIIGNITIYSKTNEDLSKITKFISRIITIFLTTSQSN